MTLEEANMKINKSISILAIFLLASVALNAYQWRQNYWLGRLPTLKDKWRMYREIEVKFPVCGLTHADVLDVLNALDSTDLLTTHPGKGILYIEAHYDDYVTVEIGYIKAGLDGTGNTFGFIRTPQGWVFDEKTRECGWES